MVNHHLNFILGGGGCLVDVTSLGNIGLLCPVISDTGLFEKIIISMILQTGRLTITSCYGLKFIQSFNYPQIIYRSHCILQ